MSRLMCWAHFQADVPLTVGDVLTPQVVEAWLAQAGLTVKVRDASWVRLRRMGRRLNPKVWPAKIEEFSASSRWRLQPYTAAQVLAIESWAAGQRTEQRRAQAAVFLALTLGAGLYTHELTAVKAKHVWMNENGVHIRVGGDRRREVTCLCLYESGIADVVGLLSPKDYLFGPGRTNRDREAVTRFLASTNRDAGLVPNVTRLRSTWIASLLDRGVPMGIVANAAGLTSLRLLEDWPRPQVDVTRPQLRALIAGR